MQNDIIKITKQVADNGYIVDDALATTLILMQNLGRPLLLEGEAGVGKTEIAKVLARTLEKPFIRLQCYEGLSANEAIYEWNYNKQLLHIQANKQESSEHNIFSEEFILERPLLKAIRQPSSSVLLIDEVDRSDEAFEAFLLEVLSDFQISIPELGTITASQKPIVILTSNHTRELSDALRRRCLYHYLDYPDYEKELNIINTKVSGIAPTLSEQIVAFIQSVRELDLRKKPGVAETLDWAHALTGLGVVDLEQSLELVESTRSCIVKHQDDFESLQTETIQQLVNATA